MTCKWGEKKNMTVLLAVGLVLLIGGLICNLFLPEEAHLPSRIAGFFSGMGGSFTAISLVVLVLTLVGVGTTISSIVSQRRNEIGLRKALGADSRAIGVEFYVESGIYCLIGGLLGTAIGYVLARVLCSTVFGRALGLNWLLCVGSLLLSVAIAVIASIPPVRRATRIDPAIVLRED